MTTFYDPKNLHGALVEQRKVLNALESRMSRVEYGSIAYRVAEKRVRVVEERIDDLEIFIAIPMV